MRAWKMVLGLLVAGAVAGVLAGGAMHPVMKPRPEPEWRDRIDKRDVAAVSAEHLALPAPRAGNMVAADYPSAYPPAYERLDLAQGQLASPTPYPADDDPEWAAAEPEVSAAAIAAARAAAEVRHALADDLADDTALAEEPAPPVADTAPADEAPPLL